MRTLIYGSCVSRDTFEYLRPCGFTITDYVARQSLLSAFSAADWDEVPDHDTSSRFQQRMIRGDWTSSLFPSLRRHAKTTDLVLWDLCDERLGVRRLLSGYVVTRSVDHITSGLDAHLEDSTALVELGTPDHKAVFRKRLMDFRAGLERLGLLDKLLLLAPPWAATTVQGTEPQASFGLGAEWANPVYDEYYAMAREITGCAFVTVAPGDALADEEHRWGSAPFHYATSTYELLSEGIRTATSGWTGA